MNTNPLNFAAPFTRAPRALVFVLFIALLIGVVSPTPAHAAAGQLDPTFGGGGKVVTDFSGRADRPKAVAAQPDGKVLVAGTSESASGVYSFVVARYNSDGTPDPGFGSGGQVTTTFTNCYAARAMALQPDGKIVVAGHTFYDFALVRYNSDGTLDAGFGSGGVATSNLTSGGGYAYDVTILTGGKIAVGGFFQAELDEFGYNRYGLVAARYNADGTPDSTYGAGGRVEYYLGRYHSELFAADIRADGTVVLAGYYNFAGSPGFTGYSFVLARLLPDGALDPAFGGGDGIVTDPFANTVSFSLGVASQPDGKIVVAGDALVPGGYDFGVARYDLDGTFDPTFGVGGKVTTDIGSTGDFPSAVIVQPDGKIVVGGQTYSGAPTYHDFALARYEADGALDAGFGSGGKVVTDFGTTEAPAGDTAHALGLQLDGKLLAAGNTGRNAAGGGTDYDFALARYAGFVVPADDTTPPVVSCPADISVPVAGGACSAVVTFEASATDDRPGVTVTSDPPSGSVFPAGTTTVSVTATDAAGNTSSCSFNVNVYNPAPVVTINSPASGSVYAVGTPVNFEGSFTDDSGTHTATWTFDSVNEPGDVDEAAGKVTATYTFQDAGVYPVRLAVEDDCGGVGTATTVGEFDALVVVYDPAEGFVTGGGWINSPAGAYLAQPSSAGKANFGFVSKYHKGANIPSGETEFQLKAGGLNFHSTAYEWLVVTGGKAQYKGTGKVNGAGGYAFNVTLLDGDQPGGDRVDRIRIRVWNSTTGATVYDNQYGAAAGANPTTPLGGGQIHIHQK